MPLVVVGEHFTFTHQEDCVPIVCHWLQRLDMTVVGRCGVRNRRLRRSVIGVYLLTQQHSFACSCRLSKLFGSPHFALNDCVQKLVLRKERVAVIVLLELSDNPGSPNECPGVVPGARPSRSLMERAVDDITRTTPTEPLEGLRIRFLDHAESSELALGVVVVTVAVAVFTDEERASHRVMSLCAADTHGRERQLRGPRSSLAPIEQCVGGRAAVFEARFRSQIVLVARENVGLFSSHEIHIAQRRRCVAGQF